MDSNNNFYIPPVTVPAESNIPERPAFRKRPCGALHIGDLVWLGGQAWRIKNRRTSKTSIMITFVLHPLAGGYPASEAFAPREWIPAITFDVTEDTRPMPPVKGA